MISLVNHLQWCSRFCINLASSPSIPVITWQVLFCLPCQQETRTNVALMMVHRLGRLSSIEPTLGKRLLFSGLILFNLIHLLVVIVMWLEYRPWLRGKQIKFVVN